MLPRWRGNLVFIGHAGLDVGAVVRAFGICLNYLLDHGAQRGVFDDGTSYGDSPPDAKENLGVQVRAVGAGQKSNIRVLVLPAVAQAVPDGVGEG